MKKSFVPSVTTGRSALVVGWLALVKLPPFLFTATSTTVSAK